MTSQSTAEPLHRHRTTILAVLALVVTAAVATIAVVALTPAASGLPVGTAVTDGDSMGHDTQQVLVYADTEVSVGDAIVFDGGGYGFVHHRVVEATSAGYITQGDANDRIDQNGSPGSMEPVTDQQVRGVVVASASVPEAAGGLLALLALLGLVGSALYRRQLVSVGRASAGGALAVLAGVRRHAPSSKSVGAVVFAVLLVGSIIGPFAGLGGLAPTDHDGKASAQTSSNQLASGYDGKSGNVYRIDGTPSGGAVFIYGNSNANQKIIKIDSDGNEVFNISPDITAPEWIRYHEPTDKIYVRGGGGEAARYNSDGSLDWTASIGGDYAKSFGLAPNGDMFLTESSQGTVARLNATDGSSMWSRSLASAYSAAYVQSEGRLYVSDGSTEYELDANNGTTLNTVSNNNRYVLSSETGVFTSGFDGTFKGYDTDLNLVGDTGVSSSDRYAGFKGGSYVAFVSSSARIYRDDMTKVGEAGGSLQSVSFQKGTSKLTLLAGGQDGTITEYTFDETLGQPVSGTVTDNGGNPVEGATVKTGTGVSTTTGSDGSYSLTVENTGTFEVTAETAIDSETQTVDVPDGGTTGVDFSLQSGTVAGVVRDQNGNPVSNATVTTLTYNTADPNVSVDLGELKDIVKDPLPPQWNSTLNKSGISEDGIKTGVDEVPFEERRVLMHSQEQWELGGLPWPMEGVVAVPEGDLNPPQVVVDSDTRPVFSCWDFNPGTVEGVFEDSFGAQITSAVIDNCEEITIEKIGPTGSVQETTTVQPTPTIRVQRAMSAVSNGFTTDYNTARPDLSPGMYRVYPTGEKSAAMTYAVAPDGDPQQIANDIQNVARQDIENKNDYLEEIQSQYDAGNIDLKTTTTNDRGEFSFNIDETVVEEVELRAVKSGTGVEATLSDQKANPQEIASTFETTVRDEFDQTASDLSTVSSSTSLEDVELNDESFREVCREMDSVSQQVGAPYAGTGSTDVPNPNVTITGERVPIPENVPTDVRQCAALNLLESARNDPGSLLPGIAGDLTDYTVEELRNLYDDVFGLIGANEDLREIVESDAGQELPEDPQQLSRDELENAIQNITTTVDNPESDVDVGDEPEDGINLDPGDIGLPDDGGSSGGDSGGDSGDDGPAPPAVSDPEEAADRVNETITWAWNVGNVGNWTEAGLLVQIDFNDGTTETLSQESEYVTIEESVAGTDTVRLEEYPFPSDAEVGEVSLDIATEAGLGGDESVARNPTYDGTIPGLNSIRLSDSAPGPSDAVTVGVTPAEDVQFGSLKHVNVTGPDCSRSIDATDGDATFTTCGEGAHRVAATFSNADGVEFTEVISVKARNAAQARNPLIRAASGPTGRYAIAGNGLQSGRVDVSTGTSEVILTAIVPADSDVPNRMTASTTGVDVARDATTTLRIRQGQNEQTIRKRVTVVMHTSPVGNESLLWRNGKPLRNPGETAEATVEHRDQSTIIDTYTGDTAMVRVEVDRDPSITAQMQHYIQLRFGGIDIPFLSVSLGSGLPAPVQGGGAPLALLGAGVATARRAKP